ncbi:hypothetical protein AZE42_13490, partial [Rhizopogon vesiculosus]
QIGGYSRHRPLDCIYSTLKLFSYWRNSASRQCPQRRISYPMLTWGTRSEQLSLEQPLQQFFSVLVIFKLSSTFRRIRTQ